MPKNIRTVFKPKPFFPSQTFKSQSQKILIILLTSNILSKNIFKIFKFSFKNHFCEQKESIAQFWGYIYIKTNIMIFKNFSFRKNFLNLRLSIKVYLIIP